MKRLRRKYETLSKKYKHKSEHHHDYRKYCIIVRNLIVKAKEQYIMDKINRCQGDQKSLFNIVNSLLGRGKPTDLPRLQSPAALAEAFKEFFVNKIILIRTLLENMESTMSPLSVDLQSAKCRSANWKNSPFVPLRRLRRSSEALPRHPVNLTLSQRTFSVNFHPYFR